MRVRPFSERTPRADNYFLTILYARQVPSRHGKMEQGRPVCWTARDRVRRLRPNCRMGTQARMLWVPVI
jgi:hypothetical protein